MSVITDLYKQLFGREGMNPGSVIEMAEHGRAGGISSGQGFKYINNVSENLRIAEDGQTTYIGISKPGNNDTSEAYWQIIKAVETETTTEISHADGDDNYDNVWDNHALLSYS